MGRSQPVELPSASFPNKKEAKLFFREMLSNYQDGERICEEDGQLLSELLQRHQEDKFGVGVDHFIKAKSPDPRSSCFYVVHPDGQRTDFSFYKCI